MQRHTTKQQQHKKQHENNTTTKKTNNLVIKKYEKNSFTILHTNHSTGLSFYTPTTNKQTKMATVATHDVVTYLQKRGKKIIANQQILEQQQLRYYRELFNYLDCDGSGELEIPEIIHTLKELNMKEEANTIKKTFKMMDADRSGAISFHEFLTIMTSNDVENIFGHKTIS